MDLEYFYIGVGDVVKTAIISEPYYNDVNTSPSSDVGSEPAAGKLNIAPTPEYSSKPYEQASAGRWSSPEVNNTPMHKRHWAVGGGIARHFGNKSLQKSTGGLVQLDDKGNERFAPENILPFIKEYGTPLAIGAHGLMSLQQANSTRDAGNNIADAIKGLGSGSGGPGSPAPTPNPSVTPSFLAQNPANPGTAAPFSQSKGLFNRLGQA